MISPILLVLLIGGCAGLAIKPHKTAKNLQKDIPMTTMMPVWNSTNNFMNKTMATVMPGMNMSTLPASYPTNGWSNLTMSTFMPIWNMTTMNPGGNITMMTTTGYMNITGTTVNPMNFTTPWSNVTYPTTAPPPGNGSCGGIIFIEQMTRDLTHQSKMDFFNITRALVSELYNQGKMMPYSFGYAQFGNSVYKGINMSDYFDFMRDLDQSETNFTMSNQPNGGYTYLEP